VKIAAAIIPGRAIGKTTLMRVLKYPHPSIRAASSYSIGIFLK